MVEATSLLAVLSSEITRSQHEEVKIAFEDGKLFQDGSTSLGIN